MLWQLNEIIIFDVAGGFDIGCWQWLSYLCILLGCLNNSFDQHCFYDGSSLGGVGGVSTSNSFDQGSFHGEGNFGVGGVSTSVFVAAETSVSHS